MLRNSWCYFTWGHEGLDKDWKLRTRTRFVLDQSLLLSKTQFPHLLTEQSRGSCLSPDTVVKDRYDGGSQCTCVQFSELQKYAVGQIQGLFFQEECSASYQWFKDEMIKLFFHFVCFPSGTGMQIYVEIQKGRDSATLGRISASRSHCLQQGQLIKPLMLMLSDPQFPH